MDYEKKYKEALEKAKEFYALCEKCGAKDTVDFLEDSFPELKESEDEKVEKAIFGMVYDSDNELWSSYDVSKSDVLAWLEKQGEEKISDKAESMKHGYMTTNPEFFQWIYDRLKYVYNENPNVDYMLSLKERIEDMQKFADKIGPKFKVGDCIIDNKNRVGIIVRILDGHYIISFDGREVQISFEWEGKLFRKWTIQDAKDGDILATDDGICIFDGTVEEGKYPFAYCGITERGFGSYDVKLPFSHDNNVHPATKEQRDTLMKAMADAGWEFDFEKKKLRKIDQKSYGQRKECLDCQFNYAGECKGSCHMKREEQKVPVVDFKAKDWYVSKVDGKIHNIYNSVDKIEPKFHEGDIIQFNGFGHNRYTIKNVCGLSHYINTIGEKMDMSYTDANFELIEDSDKIKLCHAWSEEDEDAIGMAIIALEDMYDEDAPNTTYGGYNLPFNKAAERLKSLKDRVIPQSKQEWSEEDEKMIGRIRSIVEKYAFSQSAVDVNGDLCEKEYIDADNWLKSLRHQKQWKPSEEQIKTCKEVYADILSAKGFDLGTVNNELNRLEEQLKKLTE